MTLMKAFYKLLVIIYFIFVLGIKTSNTDNHANNSFKQLGNNEAPNILLEYASLSCVHCANFHNNELPKIKKNLIDTGKLKFIYKDFPLDRPAMYASMVAHCFSGDQYFAVLSSLYRNQKKWVSVADSTDNFYGTIHNILKIHGITLDKTMECVDDKKDVNKKTWDSILSSRLEGQKIGVNSTPSFFLNGEKIEKPMSYDLLQKLIK